MNGFEKWDIAFREQKLDVFNNNIEGLLWLKVRAICRGRQLKEFLAENNITFIIRKTKCSGFPKRNVPPTKTKRTLVYPLDK